MALADELMNLTPHPITLELSEQDRITFEPSGQVARVHEDIVRQGMLLDKIPIVEKQWGAIDGLPPERVPNRPLPGDARRILVSFMVAQAMREQGYALRGVYVPDTGPDSVIRNDQGDILAVRRLFVAR